MERKVFFKVHPSHSSRRQFLGQLDIMNNFGAARAASKKRALKKQKLGHDEPTPLPTPKSLPPPPPTRISKKIGQLKWQNIVLPSEIGFDEDGGLLELEEVDGVEVVYADGVVSFRVSNFILNFF